MKVFALSVKVVTGMMEVIGNTSILTSGMLMAKHLKIYGTVLYQVLYCVITC
jgi:hypothetical protein